MKIFEGIVTSVGINKTVSVMVERKVPHPLYKKMMKRSKTFLTDSGDLEVKVGDKVRIVETRPISKNKYFKIEGMTNSKKRETKNLKAVPEIKEKKTKTVKPKPVEKEKK